MAVNSPSKSKPSAASTPAKNTRSGRPESSRTSGVDDELLYTSEQLLPILQALQAARNGDFSSRLPKVRNGVLADIYKSFNDVIALNENMAQEIVCLGKIVGREGKMTERASLKGAEGSWAVSMDSINSLIEDLARPTTEVARVITSVAHGDLTQKMALEIQGTPVKGEFLRIGTTVNTMVDQLSAFADEVTRVAREVGTEGKLGGQAKVKGVSGTWNDLTESVNNLAGNLTNQVRNIALVTTAVANGDLSQKITVDVKGEILELKNTINTMVDSLSTFAGEVTRVAKEVGTEGILGGQAEVPAVAGTWKDLTDNVNFMAGNLTTQVRGIAKVVTAVANGDLKQKLAVEAKGEVATLAETINGMIDTLSIFADQVTTVAREVGTEGKLGGQAHVPNVAGTWKDLTDNVNFMAGNLTDQVRDIALVTTAVAKGDLSQKITVDVKGEILELKDTINVMVDQLRSFADEVTRVAREVGTEGKLGGQAEVRGVSGTWKDLTDNVNFMAGNLTDQVRDIALVTTAVANGDLSKKITVDVKGEILELKNTINVMVDQLRSFADEVTRVAKEVGTEGKLGGQAEVRGVSGTWKDLTDNVNILAGNLTNQVRNIALVTTAVANGDLSKKITVDVKGEILELKDTINTMVDQLNSFAAEVTRVAREVGTEGKLGGQAEVRGVSGTWKDLTDNVNFMAGNLTTQVRGIVKVVTAVANGDLSQKLVVEAKGEVAALAETINGMIDTLSIFADQVTTVAREVGTEGILGGQAKVPNAAGTWKDLTDNVNFMANSLTVQVRDISNVATAVTEGDLTRSITIEARGEVSDLKNKINQMIGNLKDTTFQNQEQDWLKTNLARFSRMMQGQKTLESVARLIMSEVTPLVSAHHGVFYMSDSVEGEPLLKLLSSYAYRERKSVSNRFQMGEGLVGQCALERKTILLSNVPHDYISINSGLGEATPFNIVVLPVLFEGDLMAVIELASFQPFSEIHMTFLEQLMESIGVVLNMIGANMRTEELLEQSQSLTQELQSQSEELQSRQEQLTHTNAELESQAKELEEKASLLAEQNVAVEMKNREVELARSTLEEQAQQLALSSKYKSEFLANMSHELRTPLNSMLILAKLMADNIEGNLTDKQVDFAGTIHGSGTDLLNLINEILDLSKVESGKMEVQTADVPLAAISDHLLRSFEQVATQKNLEFDISIEPGLPNFIRTDSGRLRQILKNLLSNAFKFTEEGHVELAIRPARNGMIAFSVSDTGIGIAEDKQKLIFEAFQQADGTTSRRYGGTGLGLSISREIARLLGGQIHVESKAGIGSTFTLYLPEFYDEQDGNHSDNTFQESSLLNVDGVSQSARSMERFSVPSRGERLSTPMNRVHDDSGFSENSQNQLLDSFGSNLLDHANEANPIDDDRNTTEDGDLVLLIIEDDVTFAKILLDTCRQQGFKGITAQSGDIGLTMARQFQPDAITLDLQLPVLDGWTVLDFLKRDPLTRHIPVQVISIADRDLGSVVSAMAYLQKPVSREAIEGAFCHVVDFLGRELRQLLIVEDDEAQRNSMIELVGSGDVKTTAVGTGEAALEKLKEQPFDCVILDLGLPDMAGVEVLRQIKQQDEFKDLPVIIYTSKDLSRREEAELKKYASTILNKGAQSAEVLLQETSLFLHQVVTQQIEKSEEGTDAVAQSASRVSPRKSRKKKKEVEAAVPPLPELPTGERADLENRKVLIVDDDGRNVFALTSVLESKGLQVLYADNGRACLEVLQKNTDIDIVLMDVMMPEMDGYETTRAIRKIEGYVQMPIIALTAKAMQGDREKCLEAGASDYVPKPVDTLRLLETMALWIARHDSAKSQNMEKQAQPKGRTKAAKKS